MKVATEIGPSTAIMRRISASSGVMPAARSRACGFAPHEPDDERAPENHRDREQHAHGESAPQEAELRIGLAEKFAERAREPVEQCECSEDEAGPLQGAEAHEQR